MKIRPWVIKLRLTSVRIGKPFTVVTSQVKRSKAENKRKREKHQRIGQLNNKVDGSKTDEGGSREIKVREAGGSDPCPPTFPLPSPPAPKSIPFTRKPKACVFKFPGFEERFRKLRFHDGLLWMVDRAPEINSSYQISPA